MIYDPKTQKSLYDHMNDSDGIKIETDGLSMKVHPDIVAAGAAISNYGTVRLLAAIIRRQRIKHGTSPIADALEEVLAAGHYR